MTLKIGDRVRIEPLTDNEKSIIHIVGLTVWTNTLVE